MRKSKILLRAGLIGLVSVSLGILSTKLDVVTAQISNQFSNFSYTGIENRAETVYNINFSGNDDSSVNNTMEINEYNMFLMSTIPVIVNEAGMTRNSLDDSNDSNILGGDNITVQTSHNVTIIGGDGRDVEYDVGGENSNATFFGGKGNHLDGNSDSNEAPTVLLGGESNIVESNQGSIAIVGGKNNNIKEGSTNVNILGGEDIKVGGENIIAGGDSMDFTGINDIFVFSDNSLGSTPQTSGAFFLNVSNGVGFGTGVEGNLGAVSNGAVSIGVINAAETQCNNANVGLQGVLDGCLVGCTQASAQLDSHPWELLDHGSKCEEICDGNEQCIQTGSQNIIEDYASFCTKGLVHTGNSHLCPISSKIYKNVIFETYLIDSDDNCPSPASTYNQCAYQCNSNSHLTGDVTGKKDGVTMCFHDCTLPWDSTITKKHNETIIGYNSGDAYCISTDGDTCATHKANLICVDGDWYTTNNEGKADFKDTTHIYGSCTLKISGCSDEYNLTRRDIIEKKWDVLQNWQNLDIFTAIIQWILEGLGWDSKPDRNRPNYSDFGFNNNYYYNIFGRKVYKYGESQGPKEGIRGNYRLCIGYGPGECESNEVPCNESCEEPKPTYYRYKFEGCREGYTEIKENGNIVCRKKCRVNGGRINTLSGFTLYNNGGVTCPNNCIKQDYVCYDGRFYKSGGYTVTETEIIGTEINIQSVFGSNTCTLNGELCNGYAISESIRNQYSGTSIYDSCQIYKTTPDNSQCITGNVMYTLTGCANNYHTENGSPINNQYCVSNTKQANCIAGTKPDTASWSGNSQVTATWSGTWNNGSWQTPSCEWQCNAGYYKNGSTCTQCPTGYTSNTGATAQNQCYITCTAGNHLAVANDSSCTACPVGETTTQHNVHYGNTSSCSNCTNEKPDHSSYYNGCNRQCDAGYYKEAYSTYNNQGGWRCRPCQTGYTSNAGAESLSECYALPQCGTKSTIYYTDANTYCATGSSPVTGPGLGVVETPHRSQAIFGGSPKIIGYSWTCRNSHGDEIECSGRLPDSCTGPCGTVDHGETLTCYNLNSFECPGTCVNESHLCIDGQFGNYVYQMDIGKFSFMPINFEHDYIHSTCTLRGTNNSSYYDEDTAWNMTLQSGYLFNAITGYIVVDNHCEAETFYQWNGHCFNEDYIWDSYEGHPGYVLTGTECNMLLVDGVWRRNCQFVSHKINGECVPQENKQRYKRDYPSCNESAGYTIAAMNGPNASQYPSECVKQPSCDYSGREYNIQRCTNGTVYHLPSRNSQMRSQFWYCINPGNNAVQQAFSPDATQHVAHNNGGACHR